MPATSRSAPAMAHISERMMVSSKASQPLRKRSDAVEVLRSVERSKPQSRDWRRSTAAEADLKKIAKLIKACKEDIARKDFVAFVDHDYALYVAVAAAGKNRLQLNSTGRSAKS